MINYIKIINIKKIYGIALLEIMVAITITTIGIIGLVTLQLENLKNNFDSHQQTNALWVINDLVNRMRANSIAQDFYYTDGKDLHCNSLGVNTNCSSYHDGTSLIKSTQCKPWEIARQDLNDVICGQTIKKNNMLQINGNHHNLINPSINITKTSTGEKKIKIEWDRKVSYDTLKQKIIKRASFEILIIP